MRISAALLRGRSGRCAFFADLDPPQNSVPRSDDGSVNECKHARLGCVTPTHHMDRPLPGASPGTEDLCQAALAIRFSIGAMCRAVNDALCAPAVRALARPQNAGCS